MDILDDVLLLADDKQEAALAGGASGGAAFAPGGGEGAADGLDQWLIGMLPGGGAADGGKQFADEVMGDDLGDDDLIGDL